MIFIYRLFIYVLSASILATPLFPVSAFTPPDKKAFMKHQESFELGEVASQIIRAGEIQPHFPKVDFLKLDPPGTLQQQVEMLVYGLTVDVPPEYDHYGYEIRRQMAGVTGPDVLVNQAKMDQQYQRLKNADIILSYWKQKLREDLQAAEKRIENNEEIPNRIRTRFNYNKGVIAAFMTDAQGWINTNMDLLAFLIENRKSYDFDPPRFTIRGAETHNDFVRLYLAREDARKKINTYLPFATMVY